MRVSKTVREYIEKQVASKFPKTENELQYEQNQALVNRANDEYQKRLEQAKEKIRQAITKEFELTEDMVQVTSYYASPFGTNGTQAKTLADRDRFERAKIINAKIDDIIVTLELGGTKADLEKMLAEI